MTDNQNRIFAIKALVTIIDRGGGEQVAKLLSRSCRCMHVLSLGKGTAGSEIMDYLGLDEPEKDIVISLVPEDSADYLLRLLRDHFSFAAPGKGIAFLLPVTSISAALTKMTGPEHEIEIKKIKTWQKEAPEVMENRQFECIFAIITHGNSDLVMTAARSAGARGGTLIRARGLDADEASKFFHITIQPEKEIAVIVVPVSIKKVVMQSICSAILEKGGEHGMVFSVPVDEAVGLRLPENDPEE